MRDLAADIRYAVRSLRNNAGFTLTALVTLALGVGANAAMFSFLDAVFLRPPAGVVAPAGVHRVWFRQNYSDGPRFTTIMAYQQFEAIRDAVGDRARATVYRQPTKSRLADGQSVGEIRPSLVTSDYFAMLGVHASLGRLFSRDEDDLSNRSLVVVVSEPYWRRSLGGDAHVLGRHLRINGSVYTVIGVAANGFTGVDLDAADVWLPLSSYGSPSAKTPWWRDWHVNGLTMLVRPQGNASESELEQRTALALRQLDFGGRRDTAAVVQLGSIVAANGPGQKSQEQQIAIRLAGVSFVVLLIACGNLVNLLLARALRRRREVAVRLALGISRVRLVRLLLVETLILSLGAAFLAIAVAFVGGRVLRTLLMPDVHWSTPAVDGSVLVVALALAIAGGLAAGLIPTLQSASTQLTDALKIGGSVGRVPYARLRSVLVAAQAALSVVLLIGAALFVRSLSAVRSLDIGFDRDRILSVGVSFDAAEQRKDPTIPARLGELSKRIASVPGVERVALSSMEPMAGFSWTAFFTERDSLGSRKNWMPTLTAVSPEFFATTGLRMVRGAGFEANPRGVVVNEEMARGLWPNEDPIGKCIRFDSRASECYTVVGVAENSRMGRVIEEPKPMYYLPLGHLPNPADFAANLVIVRVTPSALASAETEIRAQVLKEFPGGYPFLKTMEERLEPEYRPWRLGASLFTAFGVLALIVAMVGIYSTISYAVNHRLHEFGIRLALGATLRNVVGLVMLQGMRVVAIGIVLGVIASIAAGRLVASLLYGVTPSDPFVLGFVVIALMGAAALATLVPAWRAGRVDPASSLRAE